MLNVCNINKEDNITPQQLYKNINSDTSLKTIDSSIFDDNKKKSVSFKKDFVSIIEVENWKKYNNIDVEKFFYKSIENLKTKQLDIKKIKKNQNNKEDKISCNCFIC